MNILQPLFAVFSKNHRKLYSTRKFNHRIFEQLPQYKPFTSFLENQIKIHKFSMLHDLYVTEYWETSQRMDAILHHPHTSKDISKQLHTQLTAMSNVYEQLIQARKQKEFKMIHNLRREMFQQSASFRAFIKRVEFQLNTQQGELICK